MPGTFHLTTDFANEWGNWNDYAKTATGLVTLNVPSGTYQASASNKSALCQSGETVIVQGGFGGGTTELRIGGISGAGAMPPNGSDTSNNPNPQPRIYPVDAGASSVRLLIASKASLFTVGHWAILNGLENQYTGYPQNWSFYEYVKVVSASTVTGIVSFESQIQNSYRHYWPDSPSFNQFASDLGGAAGLWPILNTADTNNPTMQRADGIQTWALDLTVRDCTIRGFGGGMNAFFGGCRNLTFENCAFPGYSPTPGGSARWIARNCSISGAESEIDKLAEYVEFDTCTFSGGGTGMSAQSGSIHTLYVHDCIGTFDIRGTTGDTTIENCTLDSLQIGTAFYGQCKSLTMDNCTAITTEGTMEGASTSIIVDNATLSGGVITQTRNDFEDANLYQPARQVPGTVHVMRRTTRPYRFGSARIHDMREAQGVVYARVAMNQDEWDFAGFDGCSRLPCPDITVTNVPAGTAGSGGGMLRVLGRYPQPNMPISSYYHSGLWNGVGLNSAGYADKTQIWGRWVSCTVDILTPYTGVLPSVKVNPPGGLFGMTVMLDDFTTTTFNPHIDTKTVGTRVFTPGSTTGSTGADSNMTALPANATWIAATTGEEFQPMLSTGGGPADISAEAPGLWPLLTVELILDQEIPDEGALDAIANYTSITGGGQTHVITKNVYKGY